MSSESTIFIRLCIIEKFHVYLQKKIIMKQVAIHLESDVAYAFLKAKPQVQKKAETVVNLWLKDLFMSTAKTKEEFFKSIDRLSKIAQANGLTPEILEDILNEKK